MPLAVAMLVLVACAAALVVVVTGKGERIPAGVRVDGVDIGGASRADAERTLERHAREAAARPVLVVGPRRSIRTNGSRLGARAAVDEAIAQAVPDRLGLFRNWLGFSDKRELRLGFELDPVRVAALATRLGPAVPPADAAIVVDANGVRVRPARRGRFVDVASLRARLRTLPPVLHAPTITTRPRVTTAAARSAALRVRSLVDKRRAIVLGTSSYTLEPSMLRALVDVRRAESGFTIRFDPARLARLLPARTLPRNATFRIEGERVVVVPAVAGRTLDVARTALALADPARTTIPARVTLVRPSVTTEELTALGIRERVSEFTTYYPAGQPRVVNIRRASQVLDGTILRPGATFSMNEALGERTTSKGYVPAPQIAGNAFVDSVGGGISQVATTLYNGAFFAGLELVEHQPHSLYIDRYPLGREATISWGGPELIFRNDWPAGVLIDLDAAETSVTVRFFSARLGRRVDTVTTTPHGHGGGSFTVEYTRRVFRGTRLVRDELYRVRYGVAPSHATPAGR
ncbi:MAG: VanW family protein [Actinomycetota bacterium]|nr:VanW family protein [Actinomycetota bacterium]